jgi:hypothetical protein
MKTLLTILAMAAPPSATPSTAPSTAPTRPAATISAGPLSISPEGRGLIVQFETGGQAYYQAKLQHPTWPGGASGVTIGIGYDIGYNTRAAVLADWKALPEATRTALASAAGVKGIAARPRASALKWIIVPWHDAESLFVKNTLPRFGKLTAETFPGLTATHGHVQGALLSLVFNRGSSLSGPTRTEMRHIRTHLAARRINNIPGEIRSMKRLWTGKNLPGLLRRRDAEARLIESSL